MPRFENNPILAEQVKAILREFHPEASESEVQDTFDALDALLNDTDEVRHAAQK